MSMHNAEFFIECAVTAAARGELDQRRKRDLVHAFLRLSDYADCGFINLRCIGEMTACAYTFLFDPEEMWDYGENPQRYEALREADVYDFDDIYWWDGGEDGHTGKVCVDSGSPDWERMVAAGRITGMGAEPIRPVPHLEAFYRARELLADTGDLYDAYCWSGYLDAFLLVDAYENITKGLSDEEFHALTGMHRAELEILEDYPPPPSPECRLAGFPLDFRLCEEIWSDGSSNFLGYLARAGAIHIWDREVHLSVFVMPDGMPTRVNPYARNDAPVAWLEGAQARADGASAFVQQHTQGFEAYLHGSPEEHAGLEIDRDGLAQVWRTYTDLSRQDDIEALLASSGGLFAALLEILKAAAFPAEPLAQDHPLLGLLRRLVLVARHLELGCPLYRPKDKALPELLGRFQTVAEAVLRSQDSISERSARDKDMLDRTRKETDPAEKLRLLDELWRSPALPLIDRTTAAFDLQYLVAFITGHIRAATDKAREEYEPVPFLKGCLPALKGLLDRLRRAESGRYLQSAREVWRREGKRREEELFPAELRLACKLSGKARETMALLFFAHTEQKDSAAVVHIQPDGRVAAVEIKNLRDVQGG